MQLSNAPAKVPAPFANAGSKNAIPITTTTPGEASYTAGFPPETMEDPTAGGIGPSGLDFNGIFFAATGIDWWASAGASFVWDSAFSTAVGGYPVGARVLRTDHAGYWRSIVDNNTTNPDTGGAGWVPEGVSAAASVYASTQQTCATGISKVIWDTVEFDARGLWDAANSRFKALYAGLYRFSGGIMFQTPSPQLLGAYIYQNGTVAKFCFEAPQVSDGVLVFPFNAIVNLAVGDYLEVFLNVSETSVFVGTDSSNIANVYGQIEYIGA